MKKVKIFSFKILFILCLSLLIFISCKSVRSSSTNCPKPSEIKKILDPIQPGINIESVEESPIPGLCEVIVKLSDIQKGIFYIDSTGNYIVSGSILDIKNFKNLTHEKLQAINKRVLSKDDLSKLDKMVDIVYGKSSNVVYFITDPDCPHCKKAESILDKLVKEGKLTVKVILLPIEVLHPDAKAKAISLICDKKGFKELMKGYKSSNQCKIGKKKIEDNINFLINELKVTGTPTFVFPDGEMKTDVLSEAYIISKFNPKN
ncbi:MAG: thiol:disulfide interchange protein [Thermodesulfobacterium geofontis]|uniref:Thiol:disulfide interchange protein n=1 Tax=Thermodesulfobacterium geofontis TaxID=1295609 RepID=A0A2N7QFM1_9BACT|nr:MAG: thiol:disulfide interchange protein [Thermodesulfobacterium geofontis]